MPDKRLIDANALLEKLGERYLATDPSDPEQLGYLYSRVIVRNQPAIDAVEVVRCRECKHSIAGVVSDDEKRMVRCTVFHDWIDRDGYCHMGAKMDGGQYDNQSV